jgi:hypothetical protein
MSSEQPSPSVARLAGARLPADHGLAALGLVMQLVGSVTFGAMAALALVPVFAARADGGPGLTWPLFLLGASGAIRAIYHRMAGSALLYGAPGGPRRAIRHYLGAAVVGTAAWLYVLHAQLGLGGGALVTTGLALLAWPLALGLALRRPALAPALGGDAPLPEDLGFEGAAVLMSLLGATGTLLAGFALIGAAWLGAPAIFATGSGLLTLAVLGVLLARSLLHLTAGLRGVRGVDTDGATEAAARYFGFGTLSAVIVGAALMLLFAMTALRPDALLLCGLLIYLLLAWPLLLRRFFHERNFAALLGGQEAPSYRRAPDAGLTALGWLLLAIGAFGLAYTLPQLVLGADGAAPLGPELDRLRLARGAVVAALQLWAGIELTRMSDRHRLAATIFGALAAINAIVDVSPGLAALRELLGHADPAIGVLRLSVLALGLVLPVGTLLLVHRGIAPEARARFRA